MDDNRFITEGELNVARVRYKELNELCLKAKSEYLMINNLTKLAAKEPTRIRIRKHAHLMLGISLVMLTIGFCWFVFVIYRKVESNISIIDTYLPYVISAVFFFAANKFFKKHSLYKEKEIEIDNKPTNELSNKISSAYSTGQLLEEHIRKESYLNHPKKE